jgi:hypothetical protein
MRDAQVDVPPTPAAVEELAAFQAGLLAILATADSAADALRALGQDPRCLPFADYVATFEPAFVDAALELVRRYGRRAGESQPR